jgi:hypothetical protein
MVRGNPPRAAFLDEHQEQGCVQRAIGPRLDPWRLHRGTEHAAIEVYYGDIGADEANFPRRECNPTSLQSCAKNLIVPPIKLLAAHVKHPTHIREGGVVEVARAIRLCVAAVPCVDQFIYQLLDHSLVVVCHEQALFTALFDQMSALRPLISS